MSRERSESEFQPLNSLITPNEISSSGDLAEFAGMLLADKNLDSRVSILLILCFCFTCYKAYIEEHPDYPQTATQIYPKLDR